MNCPSCGSSDTRPKGRNRHGNRQRSCRSCGRVYSISGNLGRPKTGAGECPSCGSLNTRKGSPTPKGTPRIRCNDCGAHRVATESN